MSESGIYFTQGQLEAALGIAKSKNLDARFVLWSPDETWNELQTGTYAVNFDGNSGWVIPAIADPATHMGIKATTAPKSDGVHVNIEYLKGSVLLPQDSISFFYEAILMLQIRGIKKSQEARLVCLTMGDPHWLKRLEQDVKNLEPVRYSMLPAYMWDNITDVRKY